MQQNGIESTLLTGTELSGVLEIDEFLFRSIKTYMNSGEERIETEHLALINRVSLESRKGPGPGAWTRSSQR